MSNLKVEGKVGDFCLNCKNCKAVTRIHDGKNASIRIIEVDCEDPYDGMVKTLDTDSDICCSMFEPKPPCEKCERFDGTYCHSPNMSREQLESKILDLFEEKNRLNGIINSLEKEKAAHMKGIERLKKSQEQLQNQVKNLQTTNEESYKREEKLEDKVHKLERRLLEENKRFARLDSEFLIPLTRVLYPGEKVCKPYSEILKDIKIYEDENKSMYEDLKYWRERCHGAETNVTTLNSKVETLKNKSDKYLKKILDQQTTHYKQCARILDLENMVNKLQSGEYDDILAKDIEIKSLQDKYEAAMTGWKDAIDTNDKMIGKKDKQIEELTRRYNMIAKKLNDIHDILKEDPNNE